MHELVTRNLNGVVDGANQLFTTPESYITGTVVLWVDGLMRKDTLNDGFEELGGNEVRLRTAPPPGTVLQVQYRLV